MDHHLESLGPERFQQLCQALLTKEFPGTNCLPVGQPDGGRDAMRYASNEAKSSFTVYQVKYSRNAPSGEDARKWVFDAVEGEVDKVRRLIERGANQYLLITNVSGTAHLDTGSIDKLHGEISERLDIPALCWWRDDINRRLDGSWDIKLRYPEVLSGQDFLRLLVETTAGQEHERRLTAIKAFLSDQYNDDVDVKFKQVELHNKLLDLFVDLPFRLSVPSPPSQHVRFKQIAATTPFRVRIVANGEEAFVRLDDQDEGRQAGTATLLLSELSAELEHVVVEGAPGQGKSTLAQYICQVHRIKLLNKQDDLKQLSDHTHTAVKIPFKLDLRDLATWLGGDDPFVSSTQSSKVQDQRTLETFLVHLVRHDGGGVEFNVADLLEIFKLAPILLVLDGLDEVADIKQRGEVVSAVSRAIPRIRENCKNLQIVITSRPAAFANSPGFDSEHFPHIQLGSVSRPQIQLYAKRWMDVCNLSRKERAAFESILEEKLDKPHLRDLARNPMQLTILLSLIHRLGAALPDKRTSLYDAYVDLFFSRESEKSSVVRQHIDLLKDIHRYLAWELHSSAEIGRSRAGGRVSAQDLKSLLQAYLKNEKHSTEVIDEIFGAMLERVVMIVSRIQGTYEFEVQPLREYFAARYLYDTAPYSPPGKEKTGTKPDRFDAIARNYYWLNVVRFFSGCFSKGELLDLADRVKELIDDDVLGKSRHPAVLGAMLLADWVFAQSPKAVGQVATTLSTRDSLRRLLGRSISYRGEQGLQIPASCGGADIFGKAFDFLEDAHTRGDLGQRLAEFINMNGSQKDIDERWLSSAQGTLHNQTETWLRIGRDLGALERVDKVAIMAVVGDGPLDECIMDPLCRAGRYDCVLTSDANAALLTSRLLSTPSGWHRASWGKEPLYLLPMFLSVPVFAMDRSAYGYDGHLEALNRFNEVRSTREPDLRFTFDFSRQAFDLSCKIADLIVGDRFDRISSLEWERLVEECRKVLGDWPAILVKANEISRMPRGSRSRLRHADLVSRDRPICDRIRTAQSRAKSVTWWSEQLEQVSNTTDRFMLHLAYWTWAPIDVVFEMADDVAANLSELPQKEWSTLLNFLPRALGPFDYRRFGGASANQPLPQKLRSHRLAFLVGIKAQSVYGRAVFLDYFRTDAGESHANVAKFRQLWALEAALAGELSWRSALSIIRSTYKQGASHHLVPWLFREHVTLPEDVVDTILTQAGRYPVILWELAEANASEKARKAIRPVGRVAREERWFAN